MIVTREGRVLKSTGSWYSVMYDTDKIVNCRLKGLFRTKGIRATNPIAVGDVVDFTISDSDDESSAVIVTTIEEMLSNDKLLF